MATTKKTTTSAAKVAAPAKNNGQEGCSEKNSFKEGC